MKILYAIQGTGNGHLSRAMEIIPVLQKNHRVDLLISGSHAELNLPFEVKYRFRGLGFIFGSNGGIDLIETYKKNHINVLLSEINSLPVEDYDLIINDFEPVSAWAAYLKNLNCISISHQAAVLNKMAPKPKEFDVIGKAVLKNYAPAKIKYGFHFKAYDDQIFTPIIRGQIRRKMVQNNGHYTVYLPAYNDERLMKVLRACENVQWHVFSKNSKQIVREKNVLIRPIDQDAFIDSLASSEGVICGAGFETPAEALYLGKKLMVVPMKGQYEQQCNAAALKEMGVPVLKSFKLNKVDKILSWIETGQLITVNFPDETERIINNIIAVHSRPAEKRIPVSEKEYSVEQFRKMLLKKIVNQF